MVAQGRATGPSTNGMCGLDGVHLPLHERAASTASYVFGLAVWLRVLPASPLSVIRQPPRACHYKMLALETRMLALHRKLAAVSIPADKKLYQRQIEATDCQIDALVYELYWLTEQEIATVEATTR
ncbi:MAG: hypothetical protein L6435_01250 [Anaerolineae bacterium]|nr:hypothetical protein [Anaerolineae bacterium]